MDTDHFKEQYDRGNGKIIKMFEEAVLIGYEILEAVNKSRGC